MQCIFYHLGYLERQCQHQVGAMAQQTVLAMVRIGLGCGKVAVVLGS